MHAAFHNKQVFLDHYVIRVAGLVFFIAGALFSSSVAAANGGKQNDIEVRYKRERAACEHSQDRAACLREAAAARDEAKRGQLEEARPDYEKNALARCEALPAAERDACKRRVREEGETSGSVTSGGIYREYREITLPATTPQGGNQKPDK